MHYEHLLFFSLFVLELVRNRIWVLEAIEYFDNEEMNAKISDTSASNDEKPEIFCKSCKGRDHFLLLYQFFEQQIQQKHRIHRINLDQICHFIVCSFFGFHYLAFFFCLVLWK